MDKGVFEQGTFSTRNFLEDKTWFLPRFYP